MSKEDFEPHLIFSYTRKMAIEDGVLIDVTANAKEAGFSLHTVLTDNLFHGYVVPPTGLDGEGQSCMGRLHDLLVLARVAAGSETDSDRVGLKVGFLMRPGQLETVLVILHIGSGDQGEAVLTLMLPEDD
jgi:hypothetical protein